eukprot:1330398-Amorphochlora_amoeboformis.AAC.1
MSDNSADSLNENTSSVYVPSKLISPPFPPTQKPSRRSSTTTINPEEKVEGNHGYIYLYNLAHNRSLNLGLEAVNRDLFRENTELQQQTHKLEQDKKLLESRIKELLEMNKYLLAEVKSARADRIQYETLSKTSTGRNLKSQAEISRLRKRVEESEAQSSRMRGEREAFRSKYELVSQRLEEKSRALESAETQIEGLVRQVEDLRRAPVGTHFQKYQEDLEADVTRLSLENRKLRARATNVR